MKPILIFMTMLLAFSAADAQKLTAKPGTIMDPLKRLKGYYEYLPAGYTTAKKYPLIVFFHGLGETGQGTAADLPKVIKNGLPKELNAGNFKEEAIVLAPQTISWTQDYDVEAAINFAVKTYSVDTTRISITGLSMGGGAVWAYMSNKASAARIASAVVVCGAAGSTAAGATSIRNKNIPIWALHNDKDPQVTVSYTNGWFDKINAAPAPKSAMIKTIFSSSSHDAWTKSYSPGYTENGKNVYQWMLSFTKGATQPPPVVVDPPVVKPPVVTKKLLVTVLVYDDGTFETVKP